VSREPPPPQPGRRWLSDVDGRISHVFLALPSYDAEAVPRFLSCIGGLLAALGRGVRCTILHHPPAAGALRSTAAAAGVHPPDLLAWEGGWVWRLDGGRARNEEGVLRIERLPWGDFTGWVQDGFLVAADDAGAPRLLASPAVTRRDGGLDGDVPPLLAAHLGWPCEALPRELQAGNVLVDAGAVVLGADAAPAVDGAAGDPSRRLVVPRPGRPQPVFHQDLYLTLAGSDPATGRPLAVVGSVREARRVRGEPPLAGDPDAALDAIAADLAADGYRVARLPLLPLPAAGGAEVEWISYSNCLVEAYQTPEGGWVRRAILPSYAADGGPAFAALDAAAAGVWHALGLEPVLARGEFRWLAGYFGSLRCMCKVLARG
jgi:hypothetical protein